ncbi:MAG: hypothetical protein M0T74_00190, partial [Desulfitobacterium hafniense]|nr:hypothetical protein [Desulfitobacterium hafniense]
MRWRTLRVHYYRPAGYIWATALVCRSDRQGQIISLREDTMPDFGTPFSGLAHGRKLSQAELVRAIRFMVAAEYEAIQLYMQLAESTDDELAKAVLTDIA